MWFKGIANVLGNGRHWRHTCCDRDTQCWRNNIADAANHAAERSVRLGVKQRIRWSTRRKTWVIENTVQVGV